MTDIATLGIKIEASDIRTAVRELDRLEKKATKTETKANKLRRSFGGLGTAIAALGVGLLTRKLIQQINIYTALTNKLRLVTKDSKDLLNVQNNLFDLAQNTRSSLEGTIDLYGRMARSTEHLTLSNSDLLDITESVNQAVAISGVSAASASAALFQLGQGLAADALRGQELNSIMEQTPRLARAIADGLGIEVGQLREVASQGKLTAEVVTQALRSQSDVLRSEFGRTEKTISQAFQQIENVALRTFGTIDATDLIKSMDEFRSIISDPSITSGLQSIASVMLDIVNLGVKAAAGWGLIFKLMSDNRPEIKRVSDEIKFLEGRIKTLTEVGNDFSMANPFGTDYTDAIDGLKVKLEGLRATLKTLREESAIAPTDTGAGGTTGGTGASLDLGGSDALDRLRQQYMSETELLSKKLEDEQAIIDQAYLDKQLSAQEHEELMLTVGRGYSEQRIELDRQEAAERLAFRQNLATQVASVEQTAFNHGINLLRQFAGQSRTISLILIAIQTAKAVKDIQIQAASATAQVLAYGQVEAAAHSSMFNYPAATAALARSQAAAASIATSASIGTGLAIATGVAQAAALSSDDDTDTTTTGTTTTTTTGSSVPVGGAHSSYMRQLVMDINETAQDMGGITGLVIS